MAALGTLPTFNILRQPELQRITLLPGCLLFLQVWHNCYKFSWARTLTISWKTKSALFISLLFAAQWTCDSGKHSRPDAAVILHNRKLAGGLIIDRHGRTNGQSLSA